MPAPPKDATPAELADWLEAMRRGIDLRLDSEGAWWHEGAPFAHAGLIAAFNRGLDVHPETGEAILRVGDRWCYVKCEGTPFLVRRLVPGANGLQATLNTGETYPVPPEGFITRGAHVYVRLAPKREARLNRATQARLAEWLIDGPDGLQVKTATGAWPVRVTEAGS